MIDDSVQKFIRNNLKEDEGIFAELREYASEHHVPIAHPETIALLKVIASIKRPERVLEAGTAIGYSAMSIAEFLSPGGIIDTIELDEDTAFIARDNIKRGGFEDSINVIIADANDVFACIEKQYDMIFMDAAKARYLDMFNDATRILKPGGILISDNVLFQGRVAKEGFVGRKFRTIVTNLREYLYQLCNSDQFETSLLSVGDGVSISVKK